MYEDLKMVDGDLVFDEVGRLSLVESNESIVQSIMNRINTIKGSLFYALDYGLDMDLSSIKRLDKFKDKIEIQIRECLGEDRRINFVSVYDFVKVDKDKFLAKLRVILTNNTILELNFDI